MLGLLPVILGISDAAYTGMNGWHGSAASRALSAPRGREKRGARAPNDRHLVCKCRQPFGARGGGLILQVEGAEHIRKRGFGPARAAAKRGRAHRFWGPRPAAGALED